MFYLVLKELLIRGDQLLVEFEMIIDVNVVIRWDGICVLELIYIWLMEGGIK